MKDSLYPVGISEKEFFEDLAKGKDIVDHGITDYFIILEPTAFKNVVEIGNTSLKDCIEVFGVSYISFFRFAWHLKCGDKIIGNEDYQSISIRPITNSDKRYLRSVIRYFPPDTWVADWRSGNREQMLFPFVQNPKTLKVNWLLHDIALNPHYVGDGTEPPSFPEAYLQSFLEVLPDYYDCQLAIVKYKNTDIAIPLAPHTAKTTFKNRDKDENGVKRHIVHNVKQHSRINSDKDVERHLRGRSDLTIYGEKVTVTTPLEWSNDIRLAKQLLGRKKQKKGK